MSTESKANNRYQMVNTVAKQAKVIIHQDHSMQKSNHTAIREAMDKDPNREVGQTER
jgi:hypothetical protein